MFIRHVAFVILMLIPPLFVGILLTNVSAKPTPEDQIYIEKLMKNRGYDYPLTYRPANFKQEIELITAIQDAVIGYAPSLQDNDGIEKGNRREPKDYYIAKKGLCPDKSRVIEKALRIYGFKATHTSVYKKINNSFWKSITKPQNPSHAITEVQTSKGPLLVDPLTRWVSIASNGEIIPISDIAKNTTHAYVWKSKEKPYWLFKQPTIYVYGLYSRHGYFYAPMIPIPDFNIRELTRNF